MTSSIVPVNKIAVALVPDEVTALQVLASKRAGVALVMAPGLEATVFCHPDAHEAFIRVVPTYIRAVSNHVQRKLTYSGSAEVFLEQLKIEPRLEILDLRPSA